MMDFKWIRSNMDLYHIGENCTHIIAISNSGNLAADFYKYGCSFYDAAEQVIHYLCNEAAEKHDIAKLDLWYFATVYLYRQSLELLTSKIKMPVARAELSEKSCHRWRA